MTDRKTTKLDKAYTSFIDLMFSSNDPVDQLDSLAMKDVMGYGTTLDEKIHNLTGLKDLAKLQREQSANMKFKYTMTPVFRKVMNQEKTAVIVDEIHITMLTKGEKIELQIRLSTVLDFIDGNWRVVHWHGSKPDYDSEGSDPWHKEELNKKNEELQKQVDEKTVDLEKKNRELKIEAALERVRARAMAMQNSNELSALVDTVFKELTKLDFALNWCMINIIDADAMSNMVWAANPDTNKAPDSYLMKFEDYPFHDAMMKGYKESKTKYIYVIEGQEKQVYDEYLFNETAFKKVPKKAQLASRAMKKYVCSFTFSNFGGLQTVGDEPLSDINLDILERFGKVFDLTYTRFNDLLKAETQAREAQIEAALERVRAASMAMHKSEQLPETAAVMFQQLCSLGQVPDRLGIVIYNEQQQIFESWTTDQSGMQLTKAFNASRKEPTTFSKIYKAWKENKDMITIDLTGQELKNWLRFVKENMKLPIKESNIKNRRVHYTAFFSHGCLMSTFHKPSEYNFNQLLIRFAKVFDQAYTRFLDLQKAEAQAREAQIEAALEKVRSRSLAMHTPDELGEVVVTIVEKLKDLGVVLDANGVVLCTYFQESKDVMHWIASPDFSFAGSYLLPYFKHPIFDDAWESKESGTEYFSKAYSVEKKNSFFEYAFEHSDYKQFPDDFKQWVFQNDKHILSFAWQKNSAILIPSHTGVLPSEEDVEILKRFAKVFEQSYVRFLDLQKAEAQAREAQIEAALEKVRSRSIGMQKSEELKEVIQVIHDQLIHLNFKIDAAGFTMDYFQNNDWNIWIANKEQSLPTQIYIPYIDHPQFNYYKGAKEKGLDFFANTLSFDDKNSIFNYMFEFMGDYPQAEKDQVLNAPGLAISQAFLKNITLWIYNLDGNPYTEEDNAIVMRFAKVFEQTYIRFLDLQTAEVQAREAQIEAALERVRSKTMAMHNSDDMANTVVTLFEEVLRLGLDDDIRCGIGILEGIVRMETRSATLDLNGEVDLKIGMLDMTIHPLLKRIKNGWERGITHYVDQMSGKDVVKYYSALNNEPDYPFLRDLNTLPKIEYHNSFSFPEGIIFAFSPNPMTEEAAQVFERFARVFGQTYRRYRDLLKAEEQARESQIEAALERVRSKAMAMHSSEDLGLTVDTFFAELKGLNVSPHRCGLGIIDKETKIVNVQAIDTNGGKHIKKVVGDLKLSGHPVLDKIFENWELQKEYFPVLQGKEIMEYYNVMNPQVKFHEFADDEVQYGYYFYFKEGGVYAWTDSELPERDLQIFRRYSSVLSLTYRRYLDLKEAEAQAREAKIEASLERIRSKALSMQKSTEVGEVNDLLFEEFEKMGIEMVGCGISVINEETDQCEQWRASQVAAVNSFEPYSFKESVRILTKYIPDFISKLLPAWKAGDPFFNWYVEGEKRNAYINGVATLFNYDKNQQKEILAAYPKSFMANFIFYKRGWLSLSTIKPLTEYEINFSRRFVEAFDFAHTRFLDLQKSEAQAKDAIKQASLDRVRGQIASMRSTEDLQRITPLIWSELETLGVPFIRCGVFIIDEIRNNIQVYLTTSDGKPIGALNLPLEANSIIYKIVEHWKKKKVFSQHWNKEDFINWMQSMIKLGQVKSKKAYQGNVAPPESLDLNFIPFTQGMLYVGNIKPLSTEKIDLVKSLAKAFSVAYARYEDFKQLEIAKNEIENTFNDLKATQNQLIQAEKMASLGELTAGIAHEIQNPLNFVNNFSEVNAELIEELMEEIENKEWEEVKAIANDISGNEAKIKHHGKRADDIVKGMLQHSRTSTNEKEPTDINLLADEYLRLSYHGLRAKDKSFNADFKANLDDSLPKIKVIPQDIGRVLLNLINNAFYACSERSRSAASSKTSASENKDYKPKVIVTTKKLDNKIQIMVKDNGIGIPAEMTEKIFQPFFTTKPTGEGTGLGLSLSYDIITKGHGGELKVETKKNEGLPADQSGTEFIIQIPINE